MRVAIALLLCWPLWVGAAEYWATQQGAGAADGSSLANAWAQGGITYGAANAAGRGDTLYLCGTTDAPISAQISLSGIGAFDGTVNADADVMIVSGNATKCGGTQGVIDVSSGHGVLASGQAAIYMQEMTCTGTGGTNNCFTQLFGSATACAASAGYYCGYQGNLTCSTSGGHCAAITTNGATNFPATAVTGLKQENVASTGGGGGACVIAMHATNPEQDNCTSDGETSALNTWGVYQRGVTINCGAASSGAGVTWTQQSGNVYYVDQADCGASISTVVDVFAANPAENVPGRLTLDATCTDASSCGSNVGSGEYGVVSDRLYINIGEAPTSTAAVYLTYGWNTGAKITDATAKNVSAEFDGTGIGCDFGTDGCLIERAYTNETPGAGIACGGGSKDCKIRSSIANNAATSGAFLARGGTTIENASSAGADYVVNANVLNGDTILVKNSGGSGLTAVVNESRNEGTITETTNSTSDPLYVGGPNPTTAEGFKLKSTSPLIDAGTCVYTTGCVPYDYGGRRARVPADMGAWQRN